MKKTYLMLSAAVLLTGAAHAQGNELFFSEYDEGAHRSGVNYGGTTNSTGSERAVEIFNPTTSVVNLNPYSVRRYSNGSTAVTEEERLFRSNAAHVATGPNTLSSLATFVLASGEATLPAIVSAANEFSAAYPPATGPTVITGGGATYFNGDDAVALVRYPSGTAGQGNGVIIDLLGVIGEQPKAFSGTGTGNWEGTNPTDPPVTVNGMQVQPFVRSANESIVRRDFVERGVRTTVPAYVAGSQPPMPSGLPGAYNIADEWMAYSYATPPGGVSNPGAQSYSNLGLHSYNGANGIYGPLSTLAKFDGGISIYPNPASGTATVELKDVKVGSIVVLNNLGQRIVAQPANNAASQTLTLDVSGLKPGLYFVQCLSADGQTKIYKELVVK